MMMPQDNPMNNGQQYEDPSPQIIDIIQKESIITFSLPFLQKNFLNVNRLNNDYCYMQCIYYDFPAWDSFAAIEPQTIGLVAIVSMLYSNDDLNHTWKIENHYEVPLRVDGFVMNFMELGVRLNDGMFSAFTKPIYEAMTSGVEEPFKNNDVWNTQMIFALLFAGFYYDNEMQKYAVRLSYDNMAQFMEQYAFRPSDTQFLEQLRDIKVNLRLEGGVQDRILKILAAQLGGVYEEGTNTFSTVFSAGQIDHSAPNSADLIRCPLSAMITRALYAQDSAPFFMCPEYKEVCLTGLKWVSPYVDQYIYIVGPPDSDTWSNQGQKKNVLAILPRNRPSGAGQILGNASPAQVLPKTKTSLSAIRNMTLQLCDKDGYPINFDQEFRLQLKISYNRDQVE